MRINRILEDPTSVKQRSPSAPVVSSTEVGAELPVLVVKLIFLHCERIVGETSKVSTGLPRPRQAQLLGYRLATVVFGRSSGKGQCLNGAK
jgi:hypothetical protein